MDKAAFIEELRRTIQEFLAERRLDPVELITRYEGRDLFLRVLVDRPEGGISLGECAGLNKEISLMLDEKDELQQRYILEVCSPGLDRPLKTKNDFLRCINKTVKIFFNEPVHGRWEWEGSVAKVEGDCVYIGAQDKTIALPLLKIVKAKQIINNI